MMMYELHVPLVMMANRAIERGPGSGVTKNEIKNDLKVRKEKRNPKYLLSKLFELKIYIDIQTVHSPPFLF